MFKNTDIRKYIVFAWGLAFILLWGVFYYLTPEKTLIRSINSMEKSITEEDWSSAERYLDEFKNSYYQRKVIIQTNNASEAFISFNYNLGQLDYCVRNKESSALDYLGALRYSLDYAIKPFAGP
ncbi:DUF4363 family protein [Clostridium polynesiense]|uniref:DUF4363 family protein n=1 Tax=Clostridium polynesiense TaxID=1325933 RepID=UPI000590F7FB|nr:DUF4363 family protein [Clostridium polynesiense]